MDERGSKLQQFAAVVVGPFTTALSLLVGKDVTVGGLSLWLFAGSVVVLLLAFLCGVVATRLTSYEVADEHNFVNMLGLHWTDSEISSRNITAWIDTKPTGRLRPGNNPKTAWLLAGIVCQGVGVMLGAAAFLMLASARVDA